MHYSVPPPGRSFVNMSVSLNSSIAGGESVDVTILRGVGATALTVTFNGPAAAGSQATAIATEIYAAGDTFDCRVNTTAAGAVNLSAVVGVGP